MRNGRPRTTILRVLLTDGMRLTEGLFRQPVLAVFLMNSNSHGFIFLTHLHRIKSHRNRAVSSVSDAAGAISRKPVPLFGGRPVIDILGTIFATTDPNMGFGNPAELGLHAEQRIRSTCRERDLCPIESDDTRTTGTPSIDKRPPIWLSRCSPRAEPGL